MANTVAESLAQEVLAGTYAPSLLENCQADLPIDRNPHVVRFTQFILFMTPDLDVRSPNDPAYLILQQYEPSPSSRKPIVDKFIKPLAAVLRGDPGKSPAPGGVGSRGTPSRPLPDAAGAAGTLPQLHVLLEPLRRAGFTVPPALAGDASNLEDILTAVILPSPYQPFQNPHPHFALCATYEQVWEPKGYTRGELISSISLAPGEQLTLDLHSWDKSTIKSEDELATESEMRVSENLTQRDSHTVTREAASELGGKLTATGVTIPGVPATFGGDVSGKVTNKTTDTTEKIRERTVQASNTLKQTRKMRIEVSREVGREQRQTRVIANTNRCHTLNCHYFEVMANYLVTTKLVALGPCLLLSTPTVDVTSAWVLCHQDVLTQALLDKAYLPGFDGARVMEESVEFEEVAKEEPSAEVQAYVDAILASYETLLASVAHVKAQAGGQLANTGTTYAGTLGWATTVAFTVTQQELRQVLYMAMLSTDRAAIAALDKLKGEADPTSPHHRQAIDSLRDFLAVVTPSTYRAHLNAALSTGMSLLGLQSGLVDSLVGWGFLQLLLDDAGLLNAVKAADKKLKAMAKSAQDQPATTTGGFSTMDVAKARVAFAQLKCHIEDNWLHYVQAMWRREDADQRFIRLQGYGGVAAILDNDLLGFLGHKAAFPITDQAAVQPQVDFEQITPPLPADDPPPELITLPTQGTLLEAIVGECDACEDFIQQSRVLDLRSQEAKAKEEEAEAKRREMRLEADPPDLSDPRELTAGKVTINVEGGGS